MYIFIVEHVLNIILHWLLFDNNHVYISNFIYRLHVFCLFELFFGVFMDRENLKRTQTSNERLRWPLILSHQAFRQWKSRVPGYQCDSEQDKGELWGSSHTFLWCFHDFTSDLFFFMLNMQTFVFIPEKLYSHLLKMFIRVSDGDVRHGSVLWENGQSFTLWFHKNPLCQSVTALCRYILNLLPQPPKLPLQLPLQSPSCPGKFVLA